MASRGKHPAIRADRAAWERLGRLLQRRRAQLGGGSQVRFAQDRKVSVRRIRDIENASRADPSSWQVPTLQQIAEFYEVEYESMMAVLRGQADELAPAPPAAPPSRAGDELSLTAESRRDAAYPHFTAILDRVFTLAEQMGAQPRDVPGAALFGAGTADAATWDDGRLRRLFTVRERAEMIADLRVREAEHDWRQPGSA